jgi:Trypsin-co-occurring domain 2
MGTIGLAKALEALRKELAQAQDAGQNHQFRFEITEAEVEFLVEVDAEGGLEAEAAFGVISLKAGGKISQADTHRLRLKLSIKDAATGGRNLEVHRDDARSWDQ